jgi:hypothetical protein
MIKQGLCPYVNATPRCFRVNETRARTARFRNFNLNGEQATECGPDSNSRKIHPTGLTRQATHENPETAFYPILPCEGRF